MKIIFLLFLILFINSQFIGDPFNYCTDDEMTCQSCLEKSQIWCLQTNQCVQRKGDCPTKEKIDWISINIEPNITDCGESIITNITKCPKFRLKYVMSIVDNINSTITFSTGNSIFPALQPLWILCNTTKLQDVANIDSTIFQLGGFITPQFNNTILPKFFKNTLLYNDALRKLSLNLLQDDLLQSFLIRSELKLLLFEVVSFAILAEEGNVFTLSNPSMI
jgi:hypothetical protein